MTPAVPNIDLHNHSTRSDGLLSPTALIELAARTGTEAIALTDHDTLEGLEEAAAAAPRARARPQTSARRWPARRARAAGRPRDRPVAAAARRQRPGGLPAPPGRAPPPAGDRRAAPARGLAASRLAHPPADPSVHPN